MPFQLAWIARRRSSAGVIAGAVNATTSGATFQTGANDGQTATVELASVGANQLGVGGSGTYTTLNALKGSSLIGGAANEALKVIDKAIDDVTTIRGGLGAFQANTLETNISSLRVTVENLTAAGKTIPAWFIQDVTAAHNGKTVMTAQWGPAVAKNPYLEFEFKGGQKGDKKGSHVLPFEGGPVGTTLGSRRSSR